MKAVVMERYGTPDVLELKDVPKPAPGAGSARIPLFDTSDTIVV